MDILEEDEDADGDDVILEPPEAAYDTDEYSGDDEDVTGQRDLNRLPARQLRARAEVRGSRRSLGGDSDAEKVSESPEEASTSGEGAATRHQTCPRPSNRRKEKWAKGNCPSLPVRIFPDIDAHKYRDFSPSELFRLFIDDEVLEHIQREMVLYARLKSDVDLSVTKEEILSFLAILVVSGYCPLPSRRMFWQEEEDCRNVLVSEAMRRNRFEEILRYLHFANQEEFNKMDRYWKLRPLIRLLQKRFIQHFVPTRFLSHDESIIKYFGKCSLKQAIRIKPIRFGYKAWCLNGPCGYLVAFDLYQGSTYEGNDELEKILGKSAYTVVHLVEQLLGRDGMDQMPFHIVFDNLFTSIPLLRHLKSLGLDGTGTVRPNRVPGDPLPSVKEMEKQPRGTSYTAQTHDNIRVTRWKDNKAVTVASTVYGSDPVEQVSRWSRAEKKKIRVDRPSVLKEYNRSMGFTDRMNQNVNLYRIGVHGKKFYFPVFTWLVDVAMNNAWALHRQVEGDLSGLHFRREVASAILKSYKVPRGAGHKQPRAPLGTEARFDRVDHWPMKLPNNKRRRCQVTTCPGRGSQGGALSRFGCKKCDVGLCIDTCFMSYHTEK